MTAPPMNEIFFPSETVLTALGVTREQLFDMDLRTLAALALSKGIKFSVRKGGVAPGITIGIGADQQEHPPMTITHERAREAARRLIAGAFRLDGERLADDKRPRFSIPTRVDKDDDTVIVTYIEQQQKLVAQMRELLSDVTEALTARLPHEHPVSAMDRTRDFLAALTDTENEKT